MNKNKFRVFDSDQNKMIYNVGIDPDGVAYSIPKDAEDYTQFIYYPNETPMQCTGLIDINNKEIYDGDILKSFHFIDSKGSKNFMYKQVYFDKFGFIIKSLKLNDIWSITLDTYIRNSSEIEIIGNIHENPNLLEGN